jgi:hypothetical protein
MRASKGPTILRIAITKNLRRILPPSAMRSVQCGSGAWIGGVMVERPQQAGLKPGDSSDTGTSRLGIALPAGALSISLASHIAIRHCS